MKHKRRKTYKDGIADLLLAETFFISYTFFAVAVLIKILG